MEFTLLHTDPESKARVGEITTAHGKIQTPIFMPVGTAATVKGVHQRDLKMKSTRYHFRQYLPSLPKTGH